MKRGKLVVPIAQNVSFSKLFTAANFTVSTQLIKPNHYAILSHRRSTEISLETCPLYPFDLQLFR